MQQASRFDTSRIRLDMDLKGWQSVDLAARAGVAGSTISRFLSGECQTARTLRKIAVALGHSTRRYLVQQSSDVVRHG